MNSLKKIAAVSAILFVIALLASIILTPFAASSAIDFYNGLIDEAENKAESFIFDTTLDSAVNELTLADSGYYGMIIVRESADNQIHIKNQDTGFEYIQPELTVRGQKATVNFQWVRDPRLTEENIMQLIASEFFSDYRYQTIIELPSTVSLFFAEEQMEDLYYHVSFEFTDFANYEELQQKLDNWTAVLEARNAYESYRNVVEEELNEIDNLRYDLAASTENVSDVELFQLDSAELYVVIKDRRSDLLKRSYNLRKEYGSPSQEDLDAVYLEMNNVIVELCELEKQYDLLGAKVSEAHEKLNIGEYNEEQFSRVTNTCYTQQVDLDLQIGTLREKLRSYLTEVTLPETEEQPVDVDSTAAIAD